MLPGVPREMRGMLADTLLPLLESRDHGRHRRSLAHAAHDRRRGVAARRPHRLDGRRTRSESSLAYLPSIAGVDLRLTVRDVPSADADRALAAAAARLRERVGASIYGEGDADLAAVVLELCRARGLTIGVAESCTGGLLGARLTAIPGSSDVVRGGVIAYHNDVKQRAARRDRTRRLRDHGAVSEAVVRADGGRRAPRDASAERRAGDHRHRRPGRRHAGEASRNGLDRVDIRRRGRRRGCCGSGAIATRSGSARRSGRWNCSARRLTKPAGRAQLDANRQRSGHARCTP